MDTDPQQAWVVPINVAIRSFQNAFITNAESGTCRFAGGPSAFRRSEIVDGWNPVSVAISSNVQPCFR